MHYASLGILLLQLPELGKDLHKLVLVDRVVPQGDRPKFSKEEAEALEQAGVGII